MCLNVHWWRRGPRYGCGNGLIIDQTLEIDGGEVYFDGVLIRKDGQFVRNELQGFNPENMVVNWLFAN